MTIRPNAMLGLLAVSAAMDLPQSHHAPPYGTRAAQKAISREARERRKAKKKAAKAARRRNR